VEAMTGGVAGGYVHRDKLAISRDGLAVLRSRLKWSNVAPPEIPVPNEIEALARKFVHASDVSGDLGFVILHRCGESFYFLLVSTWRNENELWETVYAKASADIADFKPFTFDSSHRGTFCVWELGVVWHEQQAWKRFLLSKRGPEDVALYLDDRYEGPV
jgi:hypothetical protein